jgi:hypothetical protein
MLHIDTQELNSMFTRTTFGWRISIVSWLLCTSSAFAFQVNSTNETSSQVWRLSRVQLFPAGQGVFEFETTATGAIELDLSLSDQERDDLLKSMVYAGLTDVHVEYRSHDSTDIEALTILQNDPSVTLAELLQGLRGQSVTLSDSLSKTNPSTLHGVIVGVEKLPSDGPAPSSPTEVVTLRSERGLERFVLRPSTRIELDSPDLQSRMDKALLRTQGRQIDRLNVRISAEKKSEGTATLSFTLEVAPWKCSYRLVPIDAQFQLMVSAVIDNTSSVDWNDIELVIVVDQPLTFHSPLSAIQTSGRDTLELPSPFSAAPPRLVSGTRHRPQSARGMSLIANAPQDANPFDRNTPNDLSMRFRGFGMGGMGGVGMGGMGGGMGGMGGGMGGSGIPPTWGTDEPSDEEQEYNTVENSSLSASKRLGMSFSANELSRESIGQRVHIRIPHVHLPAESSETIFLPKIPHRVEDVRVYVPSIAQSPLAAFEITLTDGYQLPGGPGTAWTEHGYAGDILIPRLSTDTPQLVTYSLDPTIEVTHHAPAVLDEVPLPSEWTLLNNELVEQYRRQRIHDYQIRNDGDKSKILIIEHQSANSQWKPQPSEASVATKDTEINRYRVQLDASSSKQLNVVEMRSGTKKWDHSIPLAEWQELQSRKGLEPGIQSFVEACVQWIQKRDAISRRISELRKSIESYNLEQSRIRNLITALARGEALHTRYLGKLDQLESQIEKAQSELSDLDSKLRELR